MGSTIPPTELVATLSIPYQIQFQNLHHLHGEEILWNADSVEVEVLSLNSHIVNAVIKTGLKAAFFYKALLPSQCRLAPHRLHKPGLEN